MFDGGITMDDVNTYEQQRDRFLERLLRSARGTFETFTVYMGHRLGYYATLAGNEWTTIAELSEKTGTHRRYVKEWLEQQTSVGILEVEDTHADEASRRFRLPAAHAEVLAEPESLNYLAPLSQIVVGAVRPVPQVLEAYRNGGGVPFGDYGADLREGQAAMNRAMFLKLMGSEWLPSIPDLHARLRADPPARVADIGCGLGWSSIGIARAYPKVNVDGYDLDHPSVETARHNAKDGGVADRVRFHVRDASDPALKGRYDLVTAFECVHDLADPVGALRTMLNLAGESGSVLVMDERVADVFAPHGSEVEQLLYGFSVLHCLPAGMADQPSAGTGTIMRADTLKRYAADAGFCDVEILPIENFFFRFYRLKPVCPVA
jgi:SAM-dependent methyltransferase